jgi:hypothetical protein
MCSSSVRALAGLLEDFVLERGDALIQLVVMLSHEHQHVIETRVGLIEARVELFAELVLAIRDALDVLAARV